MGPWLAGLGIVVAALPLKAAELEYHEVQKQAAHYVINLSIRADIPEEFARSVLLDPDRVQAFNPAMQEVEHLPQQMPGVRRFIDRTTICALVFCVSYQNIMQLRLRLGGGIELQVEPRGSDFRYGLIVWKIESLGRQSSRLSFHAVIEPSFWVPPALGTMILGSRMTSVTYDMARRMECDYAGKTVCDLYALDDDAEDEETF